MFQNRTLNNRISRIHERALRLVYPNKNLSFSELLELDNAVPIHSKHHRKLQVLVTEMLNPIMHNVEKWPKHILKILQCEHHKIFNVYFTIFQHYA